MKTALPFFALALLLSLLACDEEPDSLRITRVVDAAVGHAEAGRVGDLMDLCTKNFSAHGADKQRIRRVLFGYLAGRRGAKILHPAYEIRISGPGLAQVRFPFAFVKGEALKDEKHGDDAESWVERWADRARLMRITVDLREDEGEWMLSGARAERFSGLGFTKIRGL